MKSDYINRFVLLVAALCLGPANAWPATPYHTKTAALPEDTVPPPECTLLIQDLTGPSIPHYPNIRLLPSPAVEQSEMSIAIRSDMPSVLLAGANTVSWPGGTRTFDQGTYWSMESGTDWSGNNDAPPTAGWAGDPTVAAAGSTYWFSYSERDPSLAWRVKLAKGSLVAGEVQWPTFYTVPGTLVPDKPHMAVDAVFGGPYVAFVEFHCEGHTCVSEPADIQFSRYDPVEDTMTLPEILSPQGPGEKDTHGPCVAVGPQGDIYVAWAVYPWPRTSDAQYVENGIGFVRLINGGTVVDTTLPFRDTIPGLGVRGIRGPLKSTGIAVHSFPSMAVDRSLNYYGRIYIVWADRRNPDSTPDIYLTWSQDRGNTWHTPPVQVNAGGEYTDQWMPSVAVDPNGYVHVVFYDSRVDERVDEFEHRVNLLTAVYVASSYNGGHSFQASDNTLVSDTAFTPCHIPGTRSNELGAYMGDYISIAAKSGTVYPCWNDSRSGIHQAYVAAVPRITPPPPGPGCPFVYTWDGAEYHQDNTILGQCESRPDSRPVTDFLQLQQPLVPDDGTYKLQIREFEHEKSHLDEFELWAVDHAQETQMGVTPDGEVFLFEEEYRPTAAYDHQGTDVLDLISAKDGVSYSSEGPGAMYVQYEVWQPGLPGVLYDPSPPGEEPLRPIEPTKRGNPGAGIYVDVEDRDGQWQPVDVLPPRENSEDALWLLNRAEGYQLGRTFRVRLRWTGRFAADQLAYYLLSQESPVVRPLVTADARHSVRGESTHLVTEKDGESATLSPGEALELAFLASGIGNPPVGTVRDFVLKSTGYYEPAGDVALGGAALSQNSPNPFNAGTSITFVLQQREAVRLEVYNVLGQRIVTLVDGAPEAGVHTAEWDGRSAEGDLVPTGVYLYRLTRRNGQETRKMMLLR